MNKKLFWVAAANAVLLASWAGCSSNSGGGSGAGTTTTHKTSSSSSSGTGTGGGTSTSSSSGSSTSSSSGTGTGGGTAMNPFECTVPSTSPSGGSCVTTVAANDAGTGIECNPVTNAPCAANEQCDSNYDNSSNFIGFVCFPSDSVAICQTCDPTNGMACGASLTCFSYDTAGDSVCTHYCCTDADCGSGKCTTMGSNGAFFGPIAPNLGVCTTM